jgi:predicted NUDIX family phosphoesterase
VERRHAELDPSLKQIIPYCVVLDATKREADPPALRLRRLPKQGEKRLHDKLSIGIGGHLNPVDQGNPAREGAARGAPSASVLDEGVLRELSEELEIRYVGSKAAPPEPLGVLNDDSTPVGSVHFGIVYALAVSGDTTIREKDHMTGDWVPWSRLREEAEAGAKFESWSSILLRSLTSADLAEVGAAIHPHSQRSAAPRTSPGLGARAGAPAP